MEMIGHKTIGPHLHTELAQLLLSEEDESVLDHIRKEES